MAAVRSIVSALSMAAIAASSSAAVEAPPPLVAVPAGAFVAGSDQAERDYAYRLDETAYGHSRTREAGWYDGERPRGLAATAAFEIMVTPVTNAQYAAFVAAAGHRPPDVDAATWRGYGLIHPYATTRRFAWLAAAPPPGRENHPVVLVSHDDAEAYAAWLSRETGRRWRLPSEQEWEKAARGPDGHRFPWGNAWDARRANTHDLGPFDTLPVGGFPDGASHYGLLDAAGQVFEWTATGAGEGRYLVKGGSWDDKGCGVCRPAARHGRPAALRHVLIGFRLVVE